MNSVYAGVVEGRRLVAYAGLLVDRKEARDGEMTAPVRAEYTAAEGESVGASMVPRGGCVGELKAERIAPVMVDVESQTKAYMP